MPSSKFLIVFIALAVCRIDTNASAQTIQPADLTPISVVVKIDASKTLGVIDPQKLGGTNVALWDSPKSLTDPVPFGWMKNLGAKMIRMPGGSWSDMIYWNGNGVRNSAGVVDTTKVGPDGYPAVDYTGYAPAFAADAKTLKPSTKFAGNVDVEALHNFVRAIGASPYICVNAGTGRPLDAAEWVRWANLKMGYKAHYWEVGNELDGGWEDGHIDPKTGKEVTPQQYAQRFHAFAQAMKAVDPSIAVGGAATDVTPGGFAEAMLKYFGEDVDFVSIHSYRAVGGKTADESLQDVDSTVASEVGQARTYINEYQPARAGKIEIGYSEYNTTGGSPDMFSGLWTSEWLAAMARNGVSFATQWDIYQNLILGESPYNRAAEYFALKLWNQYTCPQIVPDDVSESRTVRSFATRTDNRVVVMLVNPDKDRAADVHVNLNGFSAAKSGFTTTISNGTCFWNEQKSAPDWSNEPKIAPIETGARFNATVPPMAVTYVVVPRSHSAKSDCAFANCGHDLQSKPVLRFVLPKQVFAGDLTEGWLEAVNQNGKLSYAKSLPDASITTSGDATLDRNHVRLSESIGRFVLQAQNPGEFTLSADVNGVRTTQKIDALSSVPQPVAYWDFTSPDATDKDLFQSDFALTSDASVRPNKSVARIDFPIGAAKPQSGGTLIKVNQLPDGDKLVKSNIRGVIFDLKTSPDFACDDPNASVSAVMQSPNNYWIALGNAPLAGHSDWKTETVPITNKDQIQFMPTTFNLLLVLNTSKPVKGTIYLDRVGFLVR